MDSFKSSKDNSQTKKSINIPTAIRFNVDEESVEDVCLAIGSNIDSQVNTWQLIKGKVSQAMEDIKSSSNKSDTNETNEIDNATLNSIKEKLSLDLVQDNFISNSLPTNISTTSHSTKSSPQKLLFNFGRNKTTNISSSVPRVTSDSISESVEEELSSIRKSFANLRLKAKKLNYNTNPVAGSSEKPTTSINSFLRKRKTKNEQSGSPSKLPTKQESEVSEVESGIEMFEDTLVMTAKQNESELTKDIIPPPEDVDIPSSTNNNKLIIRNWIEIIWKYVPNFLLNINNWSFDSILNKTLELLKNFYTLTGIILLIFIFVIRIPDFFRGILTCLLSIMILRLIMNNLSNWINNLLYSHDKRVEQNTFQIPDYNKMDVLQIPIEEHKSFKKYWGWMHESNIYDPTNHHIPSVPVFLQLDGSVLRLSNTSLRISKRLMWNEKKLDKNNVIYTYHRTFDLTGCRIEMLPKGLARKRYYNRKYPMQLTIKNSFSPSQNIKDAATDETIKSFHIVNHDLNFNDENCINDDPQNIILLDVGTTILDTDLQKLQENQPVTSKEAAPLGDETRILLFARCDREKEDWYRRFYAASIGSVIDMKPKFLDSSLTSKDETEQKKIKTKSDSVDSEDSSNHSTNGSFLKLSIKEKSFNNNNLDLDYDETELMNAMPDSGSLLEVNEENFKGLLFSGSIYRNPTEYISFMSKYQNRRKKTQDDDLWKGIDQGIYLGPQESEVWTNVIIGRLIFSCLTEKVLLEKIQEFLQKKLSAIKLPGFMEDVSIAHIHLGQDPPLIHRISQPLLDERGVWIDADVTYEGLMDMTIKTKLNLLRLKRSQHNHRPSSIITTDESTLPIDFNNSFIPTENVVLDKKNTSEKNDDSATILFKNNSDIDDALIINAAIYDSDAESSGASSSESSSPTHTNYGSLPNDSSDQALNPGGSRRLFRIVDRITTSNLFQSATEISYVQRAMENMSTKLALRVDLKGLVSRVVINIPPPPTDRIWISFRSPPRLWITAKPAVGDHQFDWSIITNVIENKLYDEVCKYLVYPNMIDIIIPFLGESTYKE